LSHKRLIAVERFPPTSYNRVMNLEEVLTKLGRQSDADFDAAEILLHLARDEYSDLDIEAYLSEINAMAHEARRLLRGKLPDRVHGLCRYLFHEMGFRGNTVEYYDPRNSYLNEVLDRRTGIPISLSILVMAVGARAGLPVVGIGLPGHFVVKSIEGGEEVLFDPFHGGRQLSASECEILVRQVTGMNFEANKNTLRPLPLRWIIARVLTNLKTVYFHQEDYLRTIRVIQRLRQLTPQDLVLHRDLGISLMHAGYPGKAIEHLHAYLEVAPDSPDGNKLRKLLDKAYTLVSRWN
jgi:regulator of sirC expression with transglutaminase-like and TPR domain